MLADGGVVHHNMMEQNNIVSLNIFHLLQESGCNRNLNWEIGVWNYLDFTSKVLINLFKLISNFDDFNLRLHLFLQGTYFLHFL